MRRANTVAEAFALAGEQGIAVGDAIAEAAWATAAAVVEGAGIDLEVLVFDREGELRGRYASTRAES